MGHSHDPTPEELARNPVTGWVVAHPWGWALLSGALIAAWTLVLFNGAYPLAWVTFAAAFGILNGLAWRRGGPAHRVRAYVVRRFPKKS